MRPRVRLVTLAALLLVLGASDSPTARAKLLPGISTVDGRCPCASRPTGRPWPSHEAYARCVGRLANRLVRAGSATADEAASKMALADASSCGDPALRCRYDRRPCPAGSTCEHPGLNQRYLAEWIGVCLPPPESCPADELPVCGSDWLTYANDCERHRAGVEKQFKGACPPRCGGPEGLTCPEGSVCDCLARCGTQGEWGQCVQRPSGCHPTYGAFGRGVRGCDGTTYASTCEAWELGVTVRSGRRMWPDYGAPYCAP